MKELFMFEIQSVSDIITNSSSEVFMLDTDKSIDEIVEILNTFTEGFEIPKRIKSIDNIPECVLSCCYNPNNPFDVVRYHFNNLEEKERRAIVDYLVLNGKLAANKKAYLNPTTLGGCCIFSDFGFYIDSLIGYLPCKEIVEAFEDYLKELIGEDYSNIPFEDTPEGQIGNYLLYSKSDNSIPWKSFEKIREAFNASNWHLG